MRRATIVGVVRLAHGVVAGRGRKVWAPGPRGVPIDAEKRELEPGAAVAVGPDTADDETVRASVAELTRFVALGGLVAAGAGVDLGNGFRSARLDGGRGRPPGRGAGGVAGAGRARARPASATGPA